jgi:thiamine biosynthesis lipoprotein
MKSLFLLFALLMVSCNPPNVEKILTGEAMGTTWKLAWRGATSPGMKQAVTDTLKKWEDVLSQWQPESDLSRFNRGESATPELQRVIDLAVGIRVASGGAFDHCMLKETGEAGFGPGGDGIDLSAIGKGFAVDRVGEALRELGVNDFVFELGGEVLAGDGEWEVAIEKPDPAATVISHSIKLRNQALATSGNYRQFKPAPGGLASHILDPRIRKPIVRPPSSVSVMAADCATADAWATALFVLGPDAPPPPGLGVRWNADK